MITAVQCLFKYSEADEWKAGLAVTPERGLSDPILIIPAWATSPADIFHEVWDYRLLWTDGILELENRVTCSLQDTVLGESHK